MDPLYWLKRYSRRLERYLNCPEADRRRFLDETRRMAEDYLQGNPNASAEEVQAFLGPPKELARIFLESLDPDELRRYRARRRHMKQAAVALIVVAFLFMGVLTAFLLNRSMDVGIVDSVIVYKIGGDI